MKKICAWIWIGLLLLSGCATSSNHKEYKEDAPTNTIHNKFFESEDGVIFMNQQDGTSLYHTGYINGDTYYIVNGYIEDVDKMTDQNMSLQIEPFTTAFAYYKDKWYYVSRNRGGSSAIAKLKIFSCNVDGTNVEERFTLKNLPIHNVELVIEKIFIHRDKVYVIGGQNSFFIADLEKNEYQEVDTIANARNLFFYEESMYVFVEGYEENNEMYRYALLECDLNGNVKEVLYKDKAVIYIDENYMFYFAKGELGSGPLRVLNRNNEKEITFTDTLNCYGVLRDDDLYVFETRENGNRIIHGMDVEGNIVFEEHHDQGNMVLELLTEDRLYFSYTGSNTPVGYFSVEKDGLSDLHMLNIEIIQK